MNTNDNKCDVSVIASDKNWIEGKAVEQLKATAGLEGMTKVVGMPDLHPGRGNPIGAAFLSNTKIYPYLVGGDIGCGMGLWQTNIKVSKAKRDKWVKKLVDLDSAWEGDREEFVKEHKLENWDDALGTIGGGNHFAELQKVDSIVAADLAEKYGIDNNFLQLMVHSGSRGLGQMVLNRHVEVHGAKGLDADSAEAEAYLKKHNAAMF